DEAAKQPEADGTPDAVASVVVARDQPASTAAAAPPSLPTVDIAGLLARGDVYLGIGDVPSARLFYERAADGGSRQAAMRLGATFDPRFLGRAGLGRTRGDQERADMWYRRASGLDTPEPKGQETK